MPARNSSPGLVSCRRSCSDRRLLDLGRPRLRRRLFDGELQVVDLRQQERPLSVVPRLESLEVAALPPQLGGQRDVRLGRSPPLGLLGLCLHVFLLGWCSKEGLPTND